MELKEMKKNPTKAGIAEIKWFDDDIPKRRGNVISLPDAPDNEFIKLKRGKQFLFRNHYDDDYWFGGTDENVFFVQITLEAFEACKKDGEKAFYEFLKPEIIKDLEEKFKRVKALRQGDIWAFPVPVSWEALELFDALGLFGKDYLLDELEARKSNQVLGTRHAVKGKYVRAESSELGLNVVAFAEGTLTSPEHKPVELEGIHVLAQTNGLANGSRAD